METLVLEDLEITDMVMEPDQIQRIYQNYNIGHRFAQPPLPPIKKKLKQDKFSSQGATGFDKDSSLDICTPSFFLLLLIVRSPSPTSHTYQDHLSLPEVSFFMVGNIHEVVAKAQRLAAERGE